MASRERKSDRPKRIHCEYCGEDYSSTYKHCPFCDEIELEGDAADPSENGYSHSRGGKRLVTNTRGGGYGGGNSPWRLIGMIVSLALIIAAVIIVISIIVPLVSKGHPDPDSSISPSDSTPPVTESAVPSPGTSSPPVEDPPESTIPAGQTATGFTLDQTEFSFSDRYPDPITIHVTFIPAGSTGTIAWSSSDPDVVSVDESGKVSHGSKRGSATITASMAGGAEQTCIVYNQVTSSSASTTPAGNSNTSLSLNRTDFTFSALDNPSVQMKVTGTSSTPTWSIGNSAVATISADGVVRPAGPGTTTITCTVDGQTLTCIVRCSF